MQTEALDKLYLEWSQFTEARTAREILLAHQVHNLLAAIKPFAEVVMASSGLIPYQKLSFANWHDLTKAYETESANI